MSIRSSHAFLDVPAAAESGAAAFWGRALGWPLGEPEPDHPEFRSFEPGGTATPYVHLQRIEGPARIHLDLAVDAVPEERERLVGLGAVAVEETSDWQVMRSPGGLPFCLVPASPEARPPSVQWDDGHRSRLVQVCIDSPAALHDAEVRFWRAATEWSFRESTAPQFAGKLAAPPGSPLQLLLQRLDEDDSGEATRAHLDLGTDDLDLEVSRLRALGAELIGPGDGWVALRDPAGLAFCATLNTPG